MQSYRRVARILGREHGHHQRVSLSVAEPEDCRNHLWPGLEQRYMQNAFFEQIQVPDFLVLVVVKWPLAVRHRLPTFVPIDQLVENTRQVVGLSNLLQTEIPRSL